MGEYYGRRKGIVQREKMRSSLGESPRRGRTAYFRSGEDCNKEQRGTGDDFHAAPCLGT